MSDEQSTGEEDVSEDEALLLRTFLAKRDEVCPRCEYSLRSLKSPCCPECGVTLRLTVGITEPVLTRWMFGVVALAFPGGAGILYLLMLVRYRSVAGLISPYYLVNVASMGFVLAIPAVLLLVIRRNQFLRWPVPVQWWTAGIAVGFAIITFSLWFFRGR